MSYFVDDNKPNTRQNLPKPSTYGLSGNHGELTGRAWRRARRSTEQWLATEARIKARKRKNPNGGQPMGLVNTDTSEESTNG